MTRITTALFDLDGTLTDPAEGITRSMHHALEHFEHAIAATADLRPYIGPPLRQSFAGLLNTSDVAVIERAMVLYRERFAVTGLFENQVYPGVPDMLESLRRSKIHLFVATSKPRIYAERIVRHFELDTYFAGVYGSELDGRYDDKAELLAMLLETERLSAATTVMVDDRRHDIVAAKQHGLRSIGVTYGYGTVDELTMAGADWLCAAPLEVARRLGS